MHRVRVTTRSLPHRACPVRVRHVTLKLATADLARVDHVPRLVLPVRAHRVRQVPPVLVDLVPQLALRARVVPVPLPA